MMNSNPSRRLGADGEAAAAAWYEHQGYVIEARNWRCREGEIDLVVTRRRLLVICEVKTRSSTRFGTGAEAVDWRKQMQVRKVARRFLEQREGEWAELVRFDVAVVIPGAHGFSVEVIEAAF